MSVYLSPAISGPRWDTGRSHACDVNCHNECAGTYECMDQDGRQSYTCQCQCHNVNQTVCSFLTCTWESGGYRWPSQAEDAYYTHLKQQHPPRAKRIGQIR